MMTEFSFWGELSL